VVGCGLATGCELAAELGGLEGSAFGAAQAIVVDRQQPAKVSSLREVMGLLLG
jgi:hypothetical protein